MKTITSLLLSIIFLSSCGDNNIIMTQEQYKKFKEVKPKYPKIISVPNNGKDYSKVFEVYLGSDGHEYTSHQESHIYSQWTHYGGCELCKSRQDSIISLLKTK